MFKLQRWIVFAIAFIGFAQVTIDPTPPELTQGLTLSSAQAKSRGGGSSGGSSSRSSSSSSTRSSSSRQPSIPSTPSTRPSSSRQPASSGTTGGRARGGSFNRQPASPPTSSSTKPSPSSAPLPLARPASPADSYTPSRPIYINPEIEIEIEDDDDDNPSYSQPVPAPYVPPATQTQPIAPYSTPTRPAPAPTSTIVQDTENDGFGWKLLLFLLVVGGGLWLAWYLLSKRGRNASSAGSELSNDIVTVTKLQIGLLAAARDIQSQLTDLSLEADLDTPAGLSEFLQESALALLRNPQYWSHVQSSSQVVANREEAGRMFEQMSIAERRKFYVETLSRTNGRVRSHVVEMEPNLEPAEYIVVTLLVGTQEDRPLFERIYCADELKQALEILAAIPPQSLAIFELLWSPQTSSDSLSYDELLTEYAELVPLI